MFLQTQSLALALVDTRHCTEGAKALNACLAPLHPHLLIQPGLQYVTQCAFAKSELGDAAAC
jgi:hypothetical protein